MDKHLQPAASDLRCLHFCWSPAAPAQDAWCLAAALAALGEALVVILLTVERPLFSAGVLRRRRMTAKEEDAPPVQWGAWFETDALLKLHADTLQKNRDALQEVSPKCRRRGASEAYVVVC